MKKTVLITGATSGFGFEFVKLFARHLFNLVLVARNEDRLIEIKRKFRDVDTVLIPKDLTVKNAAKEIYEELQAKKINIDILINNAGFGLMGDFTNLSIENQREMIDLNISSLTELTYFFLKEMKEMNRGKILNVASTAAFQPGPMMAVYYATKAYVLSFSEALAEELKDSDITITTLCPGASKTNFSKNANADDSLLFKNPMKAKDVAIQGYEGLMNEKRIVIPGRINKLGAALAKFMPINISAKVAKFISKKS